MSARRFFSSLTWLLIIGAGIGLRLYSFHQNTRLHGDVNLLALTAREYAISGDLYYPMKYASPPYLPYHALREPATQHPLLLPWLAGLLCRLLQSDDAFGVLKILSSLGGILLWLLAMALAKRCGGDAAWLPIFLTAVSPLIVDYSANGSPYIAAAALMLAGLIFLTRRRAASFTSIAALGLLCGIGFQTHGFFLAVFAGSLWAIGRSQKHKALRRIALFLVIFGLSLAPSIVWSLRHTGAWFFASTLHHPAGRLGWLKEVEGAAGTFTIAEPALEVNRICVYLRHMGYQGLVAIRHALEEIGPFTLSLVIFALPHLWRLRRRRLAAFAMAIPYLALIFVWAAFQLRFLVPLAVPIFVAAGIGLRRLRRASADWRRQLGYLLAVGALLWPIALWAQNIPMRYYPPRVAREYGYRYEKMRELALRLRDAERGLVAGWTHESAGGGESVYWHRMPFIDLRAAEPAKVERTLRSFPVRYLWCERRDIAKIKALPFTFILWAQNEIYAIFLVAGDGARDGHAPLEKNH